MIGRIMVEEVEKHHVDVVREGCQVADIVYGDPSESERDKVGRGNRYELTFLVCREVALRRR